MKQYIHKTTMHELVNKIELSDNTEKEISKQLTRKRPYLMEIHENNEIRKAWIK